MQKEEQNTNGKEICHRAVLRLPRQRGRRGKNGGGNKKNASNKEEGKAFRQRSEDLSQTNQKKTIRH